LAIGRIANAVLSPRGCEWICLIMTLSSISLDPQNHIPNGISIGSAVSHSSHRHTDHATCDICSNRPHLKHVIC